MEISNFHQTYMKVNASQKKDRGIMKLLTSHFLLIPVNHTST